MHFAPQGSRQDLPSPLKTTDRSKEESSKTPSPPLFVRTPDKNNPMTSPPGLNFSGEKLGSEKGLVNIAPPLFQLNAQNKQNPLPSLFQNITTPPSQKNDAPVSLVGNAPDDVRPSGVSANLQASENNTQQEPKVPKVKRDRFNKPEKQSQRQANAKKLENDRRQQNAKNLPSTAWLKVRDLKPLMSEAYGNDPKLGRLDNSARKTIEASIKNSYIEGQQLEAVVPAGMLQTIQNTIASKNPSQIDSRVAPKGKDNYDGYMVSASYITTSKYLTPTKKITNNPESKKKDAPMQMDAGHRIPFGLNGGKSNDYKTVWVPHYENIALDGRMEKLAGTEAESEKNKAVVYCALDKATTSLLMVVVQRKDDTWASWSLQYERRS